MKKLIALLLAALMVCAAFTACGNSGSDDDTTTTTTTAAPTEPTEPPADPTEPPTEPTKPVTDPVEDPIEVPAVDSEASAEYLALLNEMSIIDSPVAFDGMDSATYAVNIPDNGMIMTFDFGYTNDIVSDMIVTYYVAVPELSDEDKAAVEESMSGALVGYEALDFCAGTGFFLADHYYSFHIDFTDLNNADNVAILEDMGLLIANTDDGLISMSALDTTMIADGAVKR